ncbi:MULTISPECIES: hypothetical protein [Streptosporangium]|uniref:Uncharacterized protein n=1 Tax=Streptosporangium brasiliense TaxID=47480 RepID=A0ABT9RMF0_9ACTN|nr:hypothetical protein [Streptosporangium brasiliense]MDP9870467.1 hypothetical protein [Streptosporangium brasiliense]
MSELRRGPMEPYRLPSAPAAPEGHVPVVAPPLAAEAGPTTRLDRLHRAVTRGDPMIPEAACCLTSGRSGRLDAAQAISVAAADPTRLCRGRACRMRAWPPSAGALPK